MPSICGGRFQAPSRVPLKDKLWFLQYKRSMSEDQNLCKNNPFVPHRARPGRGGPCVLIYPHSKEAAKQVIRSISTKMGRQCISCHRYVTSPPQVNLHHRDGPPGPECRLPHHPAPCSWIGPKGQPCPYVHPPPAPPPSSLPPLPLSPPVTTSEASPEQLLLMRQLEQLRREKEEADKRSELLQVANENLRANQALLARQQMSPSFPISSVSSTATTTTSSFSSFSSRPSMGIGYTAGFGSTTMASSVSPVSVTASLAGVAQSLAA